HILNRPMINRIQGFALDILIVTAIGTISLDVIGSNFIPFLLLAALGVIWNVFGVLVLAPRIIPSYWFERAIGDFGQSTGVTATGNSFFNHFSVEDSSRHCRYHSFINLALFHSY